MILVGGLQRLDDPAGAHAFIGDPFDAALRHGGRIVVAAVDGLDRAVFGFGDALVVEGDDVPVVVEHRRPRRARLGVGGVPQHVVAALEQLIVAHADLLAGAVGMLNDGQPFAIRRLSGHIEQRQAAEFIELDTPAFGRAFDHNRGSKSSSFEVKNSVLLSVLKFTGKIGASSKFTS